MHIHGVPLDTYALCSALTVASSAKTAYGEAKFWTRGIELFRKMPLLNLDYDRFTLTAALCACAGLSAIGLGSYGRNGHYIEVIRLYQDMLVEGVKPDKVAFVAVISACAHTGQVDLGLSYFESMVQDFKLDPGPEHFSCVVDLLCKAGELEKAWKLVSQMAGKGLGISVSLWGTCLMLARNVAMGSCFMSNMYAKLNMWDETEQLSNMMQERGIKKDADLWGNKSERTSEVQTFREKCQQGYYIIPVAVCGLQYAVLLSLDLCDFQLGARASGKGRDI
ncbi:hypothetical protein RDABS01_006523 [Bienertia sinuspersici]